MLLVNRDSDRQDPTCVPRPLLVPLSCRHFSVTMYLLVSFQPSSTIPHQCARSNTHPSRNSEICAESWLTTSNTSYTQSIWSTSQYLNQTSQWFKGQDFTKVCPHRYGQVRSKVNKELAGLSLGHCWALDLVSMARKRNQQKQHSLRHVFTLLRIWMTSLYKNHMLIHFF